MKRIIIFAVLIFLCGCMSTPVQKEPEYENWYENPQHQEKYYKRKVDLLREMDAAKTHTQKFEAYIALIHNADKYQKKPEVVFWCKELLKLFPKERRGEPIPKDAQRMIDEYTAER